MLQVSAHAIERYRRRVEDVSDAEVICRLTSASILRAAELGAESVLLPSGHRVILRAHSVVTVTPKHKDKRNRGRG